MSKINFTQLRKEAHKAKYKNNRKKNYSVNNTDKVLPVILNGPDYVLPFGTYKGLMLKEVPLDYVQWCSANMTSYRVRMFERELFRRQSENNK